MNLHTFIFIYTNIHIYRHINIQTYTHCITLRYVTLHYITYRGAHTQDWFWDLKLVPKGVLLEVRVEVEKVEKVKSTELKTMWTETRYSIEQEQKSTVQTVLAQVHTHSLTSTQKNPRPEWIVSIHKCTLACRFSSSMRCWLQINVWDESSICSLVQGPGRCGSKEEIVDNHSISIV